MIPIWIGRHRSLSGLPILLTLVAIGALLILLESLLLGPAGGLATLGLILGLALLGSAGLAWERPRFSRPAGVAIAVLGVVGFFTVDGYIVGAILAVFGGVALAARSGFAVVASRSERAFQSSDLGPPCPTCGRHIPTWTRACPYCRSPESRSRTPPRPGEPYT